MYLCIFACSSISLQCNDAEKKANLSLMHLLCLVCKETIYKALKKLKLVSR